MPLKVFELEKNSPWRILKCFHIYDKAEKVTTHSRFCFCGLEKFTEFLWVSVSWGNILLQIERIHYQERNSL